MDGYVLSELNGEFIDLPLDNFKVDSARINYISATGTNSITLKSVNVSLKFDTKCYTKNANPALAKKVFREKLFEKLQLLRLPEDSIKFVEIADLDLFSDGSLAQNFNIIYRFTLNRIDFDLFKFYCDPYVRWSLTNHID